MNFLTDFADQAVVLPVAAAVAIVLAVMGWRRGALVWLGVLGVTFGVILVLKLGFLACGPVFGPWALRTPSGHTGAAAFVAGGFVMLLGGPVFLGLAVAALAALLIGSSRVELGAHSIPEVLIGAVVGITGVALLARVAGRSPIARPLPVLAVAVVVAVLVHGTRLPAEEVIRHFALGMLNFIPACRGGSDVRL
jgi:membrane-associated phospholipid phosphatase